MKTQNLVLITAFILALLSSCGKDHTASDKVISGGIVGGSQVQPGEWSSVVSLQQQGNSFCTGNLVEASEVYSAAHCFISEEIGHPTIARRFKEWLVNGANSQLDFDSLSDEDKVSVLSQIIDIYVNHKAQNISINFGIGKRNGLNHVSQKVEIRSVKISETYKKMIISALFPEIHFSPIEQMEIGPRTAKDVAVIQLKEPVLNVTPVPLISEFELSEVHTGKEIILTGFGAKVDPIVIYYLQDTLTKLNKRIEGETDEAKVEELKKEFDELLSGFHYYLELFQSEADHNLVKMKIKEESDKTYVVIDTKSGTEEGACHGDSGGPAFVQLANGEWRQFAVIAQKNPLCHLGNLLMKVSK